MTSSSETPQIIIPYYSVAAFDWDGTLGLSEMRNRDAIETVSKAAGVTIKKDDWKTLAGKAEETIYEKLIGMYPNHGLEDMFFCYDTDPKVALKKSANQFAGACQALYGMKLSMVKPNDPIVEAFNMISDQGIHVGVVSNSKDWSVHASMDHTSFPVHKLAVTITKDAVERAKKKTKPAADPWLMALDKINEDNKERYGDGYTPITIDKVLIVGDTHTDAKSAIAAGADMIQLTDDCDPMTEKEVMQEFLKYHKEGTPRMNYSFCKASEIPELIRNVFESGKRVEPSYPSLKCA